MSRPDVDPDVILRRLGVELEWAAVQADYPYNPELWVEAAKELPTLATALDDFVISLRGLWPEARAQAIADKAAVLRGLGVLDAELLIGELIERRARHGGHA
jgi:hypothetical protein